MRHPQFVDHIVIRVADVGTTERFYTILLGEPSARTQDSITYQIGDTRLFFTRSDPHRGDAYDKEKVGLNHLAFGVKTLKELTEVRTQLDDAGITHSGIQKDRYGQNDFIWLDDPDGMRVEFYLR